MKKQIKFLYKKPIEKNPQKKARKECKKTKKFLLFFSICFYCVHKIYANENIIIIHYV